MFQDLLGMQSLPMKTAAIYYGGFLDKAGGVTSHVGALERELLRQKWSVVVISLESLPILCRYIPHVVEKLFNLVNKPIGFLYKGIITRVLFKIFLSKRTDVCIFEDIYIAWDSQIPSVTVLHAVWSDNLQSYFVSTKRLNKLKAYEVELINSLDHPIVTVSYPYLEYIQREHFRGLLSKEIGVVELGIDQSCFHELIEINKKSIVYCGALEARKNILFLLEIFKKLSDINPDYKLTIIGDGPERQKLAKFVKVNGLSVSFLGRLSHEKVVSELRKHGIYLHTSVKESFSYSLLEAKLAGLKTCAYDKLQVPDEFIDVSISAFNVDEWCNGILNIDWTPKIFNAENYTIEKMASSTLRFAR